MTNIAISPENCDHELTVSEARGMIRDLEQLIADAETVVVPLPEPDLTGGLIDRDGFEAVLLRAYPTPRSAKAQATRTWNNIIQHRFGVFDPYLRCRECNWLAAQCGSKRHPCRTGLDFRRLAQDFRWPCSCYGFQFLHRSGEDNIRTVLKYALNATA